MEARANVVHLDDVRRRQARPLRTRVQGQPTDVQMAWLRRGLSEPGGKLPLFDETGRRYSERTIRSCIDQGWAEPWLENPIKPDWLVCRLTRQGREIFTG